MIICCILTVELFSNVAWAGIALLICRNVTLDNSNNNSRLPVLILPVYNLEFEIYNLQVLKYNQVWFALAILFQKCLNIVFKHNFAVSFYSIEIQNHNTDNTE